MSLGTTNISISQVSTTLGVGSKNLSTLCTSNQINPYSKYKPYFLLNDSAAKKGGISPYPSGWYVKYDNTSIVGQSFYYLEVINLTELDLLDYDFGADNPYYSLGDFRGYDHSAIPFGLFPNKIIVNAYPGMNIDVRVVLVFQGVEFSRNFMMYNEFLNAVNPTKLYVSNKLFDKDNIETGRIGDTQEVIVTSWNPSPECTYLFESIIEYNTRYGVPYFEDLYSNKVFLSKQNGMDYLNNVVTQHTITPILELPSFFNNIQLNSGTYTKIGNSFRDSPIRPIVYVDGGIRTTNEWFFRDLHLKGYEASEGLPDHYTISGDFCNNIVTAIGYYNVSIELKLYDVNWSNSTILQPQIDTTYTYEYGYDANPYDDSIPNLPLQSNNFIVDLTGYSSQNFSFILQNVPFIYYSSLYSNQEGYERVTEKGVQVIFHFDTY